MNSADEQWAVKDKKRLLLAVMQALVGNAHLSLEGDLRGFPVMQIPGASDKETVILKRSTYWPRQDFVIIPLEPATIGPLMSAIGGNVPRRILHVQIEHRGSLGFAAYDQFHAGAIVFGAAIKRDLIESLVSEGVLLPYSADAGR